MSEISFVTEAYLELKSAWQGRVISRDERRRSVKARNRSSLPFEGGREPQSVGTVISRNVNEMGWASNIAQARVASEWGSIVGQDIASHTKVSGIRDGVVYVQCDSTPWAMQLRLMRAQLTTTLITALPEAAITDVRVMPPGAPNRRYGPRTVRGGRGPRDTYG